mgnify:CR=1 FL=1
MKITDIFKKSWQISWKYKILWWFGALNTLYHKWESPDGIVTGLGQTLRDLLSPIFSYISDSVGVGPNQSIEYNVVISFTFQLLMVLIIFALPTLGFITVFRGALKVIQGQEIDIRTLFQIGTFGMPAVIGIIFFFFWVHIITRSALDFLSATSDPQSLLVALFLSFLMFVFDGIIYLSYGTFLVENSSVIKAVQKTWEVFWKSPVLILWVSFLGNGIVDLLDWMLTSLFGIAAFAIGIPPYAIIETFTTILILVLYLSLTWKKKSQLMPE